MSLSLKHLAALYLFTCTAILSTRNSKAQNENSTGIGNPISVFDHVLVLANPATPRGTMSAVDDLGYLKVISEPWVQTFSLDVGFNRGQTSFGWLDKLSNLFIIGVEANHLLVTHFEHNPEFDRLRSNHHPRRCRNKVWNGLIQSWIRLAERIGYRVTLRLD